MFWTDKNVKLPLFTKAFLGDNMRFARLWHQLSLGRFSLVYLVSEMDVVGKVEGGEAAGGPGEVLQTPCMFVEIYHVIVSSWYLY